MAVRRRMPSGSPKSGSIGNRRPTVTQVSRSTERVRAAAEAAGLTIEIVTFDDATRTAAQAADAVGCDVADIVKSLVFNVGDEPVVALLRGDQRLDPVRLGRAAGTGAVATRATLAQVREATGFAPGGTPPFGHAKELAVFADRAIRRRKTVWAAGGTPHTVFSITVAELDRVAGPVWADLASD